MRGFNLARAYLNGPLPFRNRKNPHILAVGSRRKLWSHVHEQFCEQHNVLYRNYRLLDITVANAYHRGPFIVRWRIIYFIVPLFC